MSINFPSQSSNKLNSLSWYEDINIYWKQYTFKGDYFEDTEGKALRLKDGSIIKRVLPRDNDSFYLFRERRVWNAPIILYSDWEEHHSFSPSRLKHSIRVLLSGVQERIDQRLQQKTEDNWK